MGAHREEHQFVIVERLLAQQNTVGAISKKTQIRKAKEGPLKITLLFVDQNPLSACDSVGPAGVEIVPQLI